MDPQNQQPQQQPAPAPTYSMPAQHKKVGPIIAILIIVLILIIGALYLFASRINQQESVPTNTTAGTDNAAVAQSVQPVTNKADDVNAIQADLNASTNGLDSQNF